MFKNGITLLVIAATAALVSTDAAHVKSHTIPHNPVVKEVKHAHGKVSLTLQDGTVLRTKEHVHAKNVHHKVKQNKKKHNKIAVVDDDVRTYAFGQVRIAAKNQPAQESHHHKKSATKNKPAPTKPVEDDEEKDEEWVAENVDQDEDTESTDVELAQGESVSLTFGGHNVTLTLVKNGSLMLEADDIVNYYPPAEEVTVDIDGPAQNDGSDENGEGSDEGSDEVGGEESDIEKKKKKAEVGVVEEFENEVSAFATKMSGEFFSEKSTPYVIGCGLVGALAVVVGLAAVAVGRARSISADSVLAEDAEEDVEAVTSEPATQDAAADESESLSDSDSEAEATEEGTFANEIVVSV